MKLQKLLYYSQGMTAAILDERLIDEDFEAWRFGPVLTSVYQEFQRFGSNYIPTNSVACATLPTKYQEVVDLVIERFGSYSASKLVSMTHEEPPYKNATSGTISYDEVRTFFRSL